MYYSAGVDFLAGHNVMVGLAFSRDGLTWHKYNNPRTKDAPFVESDPVLTLGDAGSWDDLYIWEVDVLKIDRGWEMFYSGAGSNHSWSIGYAHSPNGIHWHKSPHNPILTPEDDLAATSLIEVPSVVDVQGEHFMFYDYGVGGDGIGVAIEMFPGVSK